MTEEDESRPDREAIARIVDPEAFADPSEYRDGDVPVFRDEALTKADAILSMISASPSREEGGSSQTSPSSEVFASLPCRPEGSNPLDLAEPYVAQAVHYPGEDVLEYVSRDVPTVTQPVHGRVDVLLDMGSREPIGWRIYGWSKVAPSSEAPPGDHGLSVADSSGSQPQEAVKSDGPRGLGGEG